MRVLFSLLIALQSYAAISQSCSCTEEFHFIKQHIEKNHGGFNKKIKSPDEPAYKKFTDQLETEIAALTDNRYCIAYLKKYILFLQDHHSNITGKTGAPVDEKNPAALDSFLHSDAYTSTETLPADSLSIARQLKKSTDPIEGIYYTPDQAYKVALLKNKNNNRDYAAIILQSKTKLWNRGQVKFELKKDTDSTMHYFGYLRNHGQAYEQLHFTKKEFNIPGWEKQENNSAAPFAIDNELIRFTILDSKTALLSIRSFSSALYKKLDSAYKQVLPQIKKYRNLIIDVRNNGGGADFAYSPLIPLLYTDTIYSDVVERFNSPDNIAAYKKFDSISVSQGNRAVFGSTLALMKTAAPYTLVPMGNGKPTTTVYPVSNGYPAKIAIVYNKGCASSCESLLFDAIYSRKTIFVGENSGGYTGYGDVMNINTPCGNTLSWTTTVYRNQWRYEFVGIPPAYKIPDTEKDWIGYTKQLLEQ